MKPSDLRRDAYTWQAIADSAMRRRQVHASNGHRHLADRVELVAEEALLYANDMAALADELEARNAS